MVRKRCGPGYTGSYDLGSDLIRQAPPSGPPCPPQFAVWG